MTTPGTYQNGFFPRDGRAVFPSLWSGCVGAWFPGLGPSGVTLRGWSPHKSHGTLTGGPAWTASSGQYALSFDASDDYVDLGNPEVLRLTKAITISAWYQTTSSGNNTILAKFNGPFSQRAYKLRINNNTVDVVISLNGSTNAVTITDTANTADGVWHFGAMTNEGTGAANSAKLYVDGRVTLATGVSSIFNSSVNTQIGRQDDAGNPTLYSGLIDDVRVYDRALSLDEIKTLSMRRGVAYEMADDAEWNESAASIFKAYLSSRRTAMIGGGVS